MVCKSRLSLLLCGLWISVVPSPDATSLADEYTLEDIKRAHQKWRDSIVNFRVKAEVAFEDGHAVSKEPDYISGDVRSQYDWIWTDSGKARRYRFTTVDGKDTGRDTLFATDGRRKISFWRPHGDPPTTPHEVKISSGGSNGMSHVFPPFYGLWFPEQQGWLADVLEAGLGKLIGHQMIDEVVCPQILITETFEITARTIIAETRLVLDPRHGLLPMSGDSDMGLRKYSVESFQHIDPPGVWLPKAGIMEEYVDGELYTRSRWKIEDIKMNQNFPKSLFEPKIPKGAKVFDSMAKKSPYYKGGKPGGWYRIVSRNPAEPVEGDSETSGVPLPEFWSRWSVPLLVGLSLAFFLFAIYLRRRRARG